MELLKSKYKKMDLEKLVISAQNNDFKALEELIKRVQKDVFLTFTYLCRSEENIFDLTQEALIRIAKNISSLQTPKNLKSWINQIVTHIFYDEIRKKNRKPKEISIDECQSEAYSTNPIAKMADKKCKPMEKCLSEEFTKLVKSEIQKLPEQFKIAIILREIQGLSYNEIAKITEASTGTVKSRIARARTKLKDRLKNYL